MKVREIRAFYPSILHTSFVFFNSILVLKIVGIKGLGCTVLLDIITGIILDSRSGHWCQ